MSILLVEDDTNDVLLMKHALEKNGIRSPLQVVGDGEEAVSYLQHSGLYSDRTRLPFPRVILMDLKMHRSSGLLFPLLVWHFFGVAAATPAWIVGQALLAASILAKPDGFGHPFAIVTQSRAAFQAS